MDRRRVAAFALLVLSNLLWSGNWVIGRAVRDSFDPVALNFWRWLVAALVMAPLGLAEAARARSIIRRHAALLALLALLGVVGFQTLVYLGLRSTTAINAVLINAAGPLFMVACSWILERERASLRQIAGMAISFAGVVIIVCQGELQRLAQLELHSGDLWILVAMPMWGLYSVLLKRLPADLRGTGLAFSIAAIGVAMLVPLYFADAARGPWRWPSAAEVGAVLYIAVAASVLAFLAWNRGVALVGANAAGFTLPLLPAFGTVLAIVFLGEAFRAFHAAAFLIIVAGVGLATYRRT
ncbi:MAG TPA: DMT family transporter [Burkholderiales bacterium]|nr:DMT family transporter [Burkholderiales bacterium]